MLNDLNWFARKEAVFVSLVGDKRETLYTENEATKQNISNKIVSTKKKNATYEKKKKTNLHDLYYYPITLEKLKLNVIARLRRKGFIEGVQIIVSYL